MNLTGANKVKFIDIIDKAVIRDGTAHLNNTLNDICTKQKSYTGYPAFAYQGRFYEPTYTYSIRPKAGTMELIDSLHMDMDIYLEKLNYLNGFKPHLTNYFRRIMMKCTDIEEFLHQIPPSLARKCADDFELVTGSGKNKKTTRINPDKFQADNRVKPNCYDEDIENFIYDCLGLRLIWGN